jgi:hypothetical protein
MNTIRIIAATAPLVLPAASCMICPAIARDNGQYAQVDPSIRQWFNSLASQAGHNCCSFADGRSITDADWDIAGDHYRVRVDGVWLDVPEESVVTAPNRIGTAVVWPAVTRDRDGNAHVYIRCFMPGTGT